MLIRHQLVLQRKQVSQDNFKHETTLTGLATKGNFVLECIGNLEFINNWKNIFST